MRVANVHQHTRARLIAAHRESAALCCAHTLCRPDGTRDEETAFKLALPTHGTNDFFSSLSLLNFFSALSLSLLLCQCIEIQKGSRIKKKTFFTIEMKKAAPVKV